MSLEPNIGYLVQVACTWEVLARKAGNVCPGREFPDLSVNDFLASAAAIAPVLDRAPQQPLGATILQAIEATRQVVNTNTNLGIVLLLAPLATVPRDQALLPGLTRVLANTTVDDARNVYAAIRLARPGGLGQAKEQDVHDEPTLPLRDVMGMARDRDLIAAQYVTDFGVCMDTVGRVLAQMVQTHGTIEQAIIETHLYLLFRNGDDLIRRKIGPELEGPLRLQAIQVLNEGLDTPAGRKAFREFDAWLRADGHTRNPGTTADMIAAGLFVALREGAIPLSATFAWEQHPFCLD